MKQYKKFFLLCLLTTLVTVKGYSMVIGDTIVYQNQTISGAVSLQDSSAIIVRNITVTERGHLKVRSQNCVELKPLFEVKQGGTLEISGGHLYHIHYTYDSTGNVINRRRE